VEKVCEVRAEEIAAKDRRSLSIFSVKKEAKLSTREVDDVKEGKGDAHLRRSSLFTVCQRRRGFFKEEETRLEK